MVSQRNKQEVELIKKSLEEFPVIGIINLNELPSLQLQKLRAKLKNIFSIRGVKRRLFKLALEQTNKENIKELEKYLDNCMPALLLSKEDPFKIAKLVTKNKSNAPAKPGQKAPFDLIIPAGPTPFAPGPIIGELGQLGIKTKVENGKLTSLQDVTVVKKDEEVSFKAADLLVKLGIEPMEIGLNLVAIYDKGQIYSGDTLIIDEKEYLNKLKQASSFAFNLAINLNYPTKETIQLLIQKASLEANALQSNLPEEKKTEEPLKAEPKPEEKKEEQPQEIKEEPKIEEKQPEIKEESKEPVQENIIKEETNELQEKSQFIEEKKKEIKPEEMQDASNLLLELTDKKIKENDSKKQEESKTKTPTARELAGLDNQKQHGGK